MDPNNPRNQENFEQECRLLKGIRHPNIVQCLGVHRYEESGVPRTVLLMELMDESLTKFLERFTEKRLPYHVQVNISHDVALALAFLHSNNIIHRDLSSNNVLLIGPGNRAKVTDFGMSKLNLRTSNLTQCPGTMQYMPPEAFSDPPRYTVKLDCFQAGVLMVQILTKEFPAPTGRFREEENRKSEVGWINIPIPEVSRRENHLSLVSSDNPMLTLAMQCLKDREQDRPSAENICRFLAALKLEDRYTESVSRRVDLNQREREELIQLRSEKEENTIHIQTLQNELQRVNEESQQKEHRIRILSKAHHEKCEEKQQLRDELQEKNSHLRQKEEDFREELQRMEDIKHRLRRELQNQSTHQDRERS